MTTSKLEQVLSAGHFAMTAETSPPDAASAEAVLNRVNCLKGIKTEGRAICAELLQGFSEIKGCAGTHLMAPHQEAACAQVIEESGLLAKR
ncbi:MAG: hypothetical protein GY806_13100 [Gammaproteobacteria bacterium]|nr:hypothetical protein [Gammaproteobacteria bacterium]